MGTKEVKTRNKGVTLIALVVTIIVLLILAGVTIATLTGDNGILTRAQEAKNKTEQAQKDEENVLNSYEDKINEYAGIDWDTALANAQKHPDQKTSTAIGVGTDGRPVNMDLWEFTLLDDGTYGLNDATCYEAMKESNWANTNKGYIGTFKDGKIIGTIPQYIKASTDDKFKEVTGLQYTFKNCSELTQSPLIPNTILDMWSTFNGCNNLVEITNISVNVLNMRSTFQSCTSLKQIEFIPNKVIIMGSTFYGCTSLTDINLTIPNSVECLQGTFMNCSNLSGKLLINANVSRKIYNNEDFNMITNSVDIANCFKGTSINNDVLLEVGGATTILSRIVSDTKSETSNIKLIK